MKLYAIIVILICFDRNKKAFHTLSLFCHALSRLNDGLTNSLDKKYCHCISFKSGKSWGFVIVFAYNCNINHVFYFI